MARRSGPTAALASGPGDRAGPERPYPMQPARTHTRRAPAPIAGWLPHTPRLRCSPSRDAHRPRRRGGDWGRCTAGARPRRRAPPCMIFPASCGSTQARHRLSRRDHQWRQARGPARSGNRRLCRTPVRLPRRRDGPAGGAKQAWLGFTEACWNESGGSKRRGWRESLRPVKIAAWCRAARRPWCARWLRSLPAPSAANNRRRPSRSLGGTAAVRVGVRAHRAPGRRGSGRCRGWLPSAGYLHACRHRA
jgi:hypothetical protein